MREESGLEEEAEDGVGEEWEEVMVAGPGLASSVIWRDTWLGNVQGRRPKTPTKVILIEMQGTREALPPPAAAAAEAMSDPGGRDRSQEAGLDLDRC